VGAIRTDHEVKVDLDLSWSLPPTDSSVFPHFEPGFILPKVGSSELVVKKEGNIRHLLQDIEEPLVEAAAVDGQDTL
jgi:hypothetical protein